MKEGGWLNVSAEQHAAEGDVEMINAEEKRHQRIVVLITREVVANDGCSAASDARGRASNL